MIGEGDGRPEYEFFRVRAAFRLSDGTTVVANAGTSELRYYDEEGRWLRSLGRRGQGPGEFEFLYSADAMQGDTVFAWDHMPHRVTLFPPGEEAPITFTVSLAGERVPYAGRTALVVPERATVTYSGEIWVVPATPYHLLSGRRRTQDGGSAIQPDRVAAPGVYHFRPPLYRIDRAGEVAQRTEPVPGDPWAVLEGPRMNTWPFGGWLELDGGSETLVAGRGAEPEVWVASRDGRARPVELDLSPARAITDQIWDEMTARRMQSLADFYAAIPRPDSIPHYSSLVMDDEDRIWLGEYHVTIDIGPERRWEVFDLDGSRLATLHLPADLTVTDVRDGYLTGVVRDDFDVERVVVYRIDDGSG